MITCRHLKTDNLNQSEYIGGRFYNCVVWCSDCGAVRVGINKEWRLPVGVFRR